MVSATEALRQKREQLEREIAEFTSRKEKEYRSFERQFLPRISHGADAIVPDNDDDDSNPPWMNGHTQQQDPLSGPASPRYDYPLGSALNGANEGITRNGQRESDNYSGTTTFSRNAPGVPASSFSQLHERELEFQGLFTPAYLPLLVGRRGDTESRNHESRQREKTSFEAESQRQGSTNDYHSTKHYSSSATFPSDRIGSSASPQPAPIFSASVPRQPCHHRRSLSRSDISISSLRSSLRDPNQPRSPKRVLFSLDNEVVSPSTSPIVQRNMSGQGAILPNTFIVPQPFGSSGLGAARLKRNEPDSLHWTKVLQSSAGTDGATNPSGIPQTASAPWPGLADRSSKSTGDDFERIDPDAELFDFDEDISRSGNESGMLNEDEEGLGSDEDEGNSERLVSNSPHAGSLPIEIKWPPRLGPKK